MSLPSTVRAVRFKENPIITPALLGAAGHANINGPSLIRVPSWVQKPLGKYYLYFADHGGKHIKLAYADDLHGPWKIHEGGTLQLMQATGCTSHIASPDVVIDEPNKQIRMYYHGVTKGSGQKTFVALSADGLNFTTNDTILAEFYLRVWRWDGMWYGMAKGGELYRSKDGLTPFEKGSNPLDDGQLRKPPFNTAGPRHVALDLRGSTLWVYYSSIGDEPEHILRCRLELVGDWKSWRAADVQSILKPEMEYEGARLPLKPSIGGAASGLENALRDPAIFCEDGHVYLLYSVAGENGIAIAEMVETVAHTTGLPIMPAQEHKR